MRFLPIVVLFNAYLLAAAPPRPLSSSLALAASPTPPPSIPTVLEIEKRKLVKSSPKDDNKKTPIVTPTPTPRGRESPPPTPVSSSPKRGGQSPPPTPVSSPKHGGQSPPPTPVSSPKANHGKSSPAVSPTPTPDKPGKACKKGKKRMVQCEIGDFIKERYEMTGKKATFEDLPKVAAGVNIQNG